MRGLLDGDEAIFKAAVIKQEDVDWDNEDGDVITRPPTLREAKRSLVNIVEAWLRAADCDELTFVVSPPARGLFRRGLAPTYKSGRGEKPEHYAELEAWAIDRWGGVWFPGLEADDTMGHLSGPGRTIISSDKDMKTVPGRLYVPKSGKVGVISPDRADYQWMYQTLIGDTTDGFSGCTGCGDKGAREILDRHAHMRDWWPEVVARYRVPKVGRYASFPSQCERDALVQAQLARILRPNEYDPKTGAVAYACGPHPITFNAHELAR